VSATRERSERRVRAVGFLAHAALLRSGGRVDVLDGVCRDIGYVKAGGELIWIGGEGAPMHPRAVLLDSHASFAAGITLRVEGIEPWRSPTVAGVDDPQRLHRHAEGLRRDIARAAAPCGFGALLRGEAPAFPLARSLPHLEALARACDADDAEAAREAAMPMLGLGAGLTPSGDDLVGATFFARRTLARSALAAGRWSRAAEPLARASDMQSHPIAAALFRDLVRGNSFEPLHRLGGAIGCGGDSALAAARDLVVIGHSSGWDMLMGFLIATTGCVHGETIRANAKDPAHPVASLMQPLSA
jgi:hypothetical protein